MFKYVFHCRMMLNLQLGGFGVIEKKNWGKVGFGNEVEGKERKKKIGVSAIRKDSISNPFNVLHGCD